MKKVKTYFIIKIPDENIFLNISFSYMVFLKTAFVKCRNINDLISGHQGPPPIIENHFHPTFKDSSMSN